MPVGQRGEGGRFLRRSTQRAGWLARPPPASRDAHARHFPTTACQGSWSIGIFKGPSPFELVPLEAASPRQDTAVAWPAANPVLTCASVTDAPSNFGVPRAPQARVPPPA